MSGCRLKSWVGDTRMLESLPRRRDIPAPVVVATAFPTSLSGRASRVIANATRAQSTFSPAASATGAFADAGRLRPRPQLKAQGIDVIDLGGGDPDFITPEHIRKAATEAMNAGDTHYVASAGTPAFRKAIAAKLSTDNGIEVDPSGEIIVTPGGKRRSSKPCWPWSSRAST